MDTCAWDGCSQRIYAKRLCSRHYQRARYHGELPPSEAVDRNCERCGKRMVNRKSTRARYCSVECNEAARNAAVRARTADRRASRKCQNCGAVFGLSRGGKAKFCSDECNIKFHNRRKAEAKRQADLAKRIPCLNCGAEIPDEKRSNARYCTRDCMNKHVRARNYDSDRARDYNQKYNYGVSAEEVAALLGAQGGVCAICRTDTWPGRHNRPHTDHNHVTGRVRGILCTLCNNGLGNFGDDPARLRAAADYLECAASVVT